MKHKIIVIALLFLCKQSFTQDLNLYERHIYISGGDTLPYRLLLPENYDVSKKYPLIFFLHGAGERGNDNEKQLVHGAKMFLKEDVIKKFPAIIVFPQCPQNSFWSNVDFKTDVWACGIILYNLCTLRQPFNGNGVTMNKNTHNADFNELAQVFSFSLLFSLFFFSSFFL